MLVAVKQIMLLNTNTKEEIEQILCLIKTKLLQDKNQLYFIRQVNTCLNLIKDQKKKLRHYNTVKN